MVGISSRVTLGRFTLLPQERQLLVDGEPAKLGARAFDVLLALAERRDRVVSKDELLVLVWPEVVVEENNLQVQISALRKVLGPQAIATIPGRGYRFTGPSPSLEAPGAATEPAAPAPRPSVLLAVLPFENATGDTTIDSLCDGISESLINRLSSLDVLRVISRTSAFAFKGKPMAAMEIGRKLGVDALVVGSLGQRGASLAITAGLVSIRDDTQLWGDKYSRPGDDMLQVEGEIAATIAAALCRRLSGADKGKLARAATSDPEACRLPQGTQFPGRQPAGDGQERRLFSAGRDPCARLRHGPCGSGRGPPAAGAPARARSCRGLAHMREAARLDPLSVGPAHNMAIVALVRGDLALAAAGFRHAIDIDPNWTWGYTKLARTLALQKKCDEAFAQAEIAERRIAGGAAPLSWSWLGATYATCGDAALARHKLDQLHALEEKQYVDPVTIAMIHGALGEMDEALGWYEKAFTDRTPNMVYAAILPGWNPELVGNARYQAIVDRRGLPKPAR